MSDAHTTTFSMPQRGVCSVCGKPAVDGRSTKCAEHKPQTRTAGTRVRPDVRTEKPGSPPPNSTPEDAKKARARILTVSINDDLNPVLVQTFAFLCQPVPAENFYKTTDKGELQLTQLGEQLTITGWQAQVLGKAAAELESSPLAKSVAMNMGPLMPVLYGIGGVAVLGIHAYKLFSVRDQLIAQYKTAVAEAEAQNSAATPSQPPSQNGAETVYEGFHIPDDMSAA